MTSCIFPAKTSVFPSARYQQNHKGTGLKIDKSIFNENLSKTQAYCEWRMSDKTLNNATVFRSFNPTLNSRKLFEFQRNQYNNKPESGFNAMNQSEWTIDPLEENVIEHLYSDQLANKNKFAKVAMPEQSFKGDIIVSKIDLTLLDGASEFQSQGFFDTYDIPPIDTWFYMSSYDTSRLIFAWVPQKYKSRVNQSILVNCVDCIGWFSEWYPQESNRVIAN